MISPDLREMAVNLEDATWQVIDWPLLNGYKWSCFARMLKEAKNGLELCVVLPVDVVAESVVLGHVPKTVHSGHISYSELDTEEAYTVSFTHKNGGYLLELAPELKVDKGWRLSIQRIASFIWCRAGTMPE